MSAAPEPGISAPASAGSIDVAALLRAALPLHQGGRLDEAEQLYRRILAAQPRHFDSLHLLGVICSQRGEHAAAVRQIDAAIAVNPAIAAAHNNRGVASNALGRRDDALASFERAVALAPDYFDAWHNRANTLLDLGRFEEATLGYERAIALHPDLADLFLKRGHALTLLNRLAPAIHSYDGAIARAPNERDAHFHRAMALARLGRFDEALEGYDKVITLKPEDAQAFSNRGAVLKALRRIDDALASYDRAIALDPAMAVAYSNRGILLKEMNQPDEALASFARALALQPDFDYLKGTYLHAKMQVCDWSDYERDCAQVSTSLAAGAAASFPFQLLAWSSDPATQLKCAKRVINDRYPITPSPLWQGDRYSHHRIRVGYLSSDFRDHPVVALTAGLFANHDRTGFETVAISLKCDEHAGVRDRLMPLFDRFIDADGMSDAEIARLVRELEIDIAVDLNGFTGGARPAVFAHRPAPVQVNYLGFAGTLGRSTWDYIVADRFVIPEDDRVHYAENVVYLPDCFMVNDGSRKISPRTPSRREAGLPATGFVFCCFNNSFKITPDVFDVWMRLLRRVEGSVIWLSANAGAVANLRWEAERRGVAAERLVFAPRLPANEDHLARLRLADLFVDTLHFNAHTTAADALWAGVPVLTCPGRAFASRVAGSLLGAAGLPELVTNSLTDYEALALRLAEDPAQLSPLRQKLARGRASCPLFDTERFVRHLETAYTTMWKRAERGEPPVAFAVAPDHEVRTRAAVGDAHARNGKIL